MRTRLFFAALLALPLALHPASALAAPPSPAYHLDFRGQIGGSTYAVALDEANHRAYIGLGPRLVVLDVSDPAKPSLQGQTPPLPALVRAVALSGNYAYVGAGSALYAVDVTDPALPTIANLASPCSTGYMVQDVTVAGSYAYVAADTGGLRVISLASPGSPAPAKTVPAGRAYGVAVWGGYAYVAASDSPSGTLRIVDVTSPLSAAVAVTLTLLQPANDVAVAETSEGKLYGYIADGQAGLVAIGLANPLAPAPPQYVPYASYSSAYGVAATSTGVYLADTSYGLCTFDSSGSPGDPQYLDQQAILSPRGNQGQGRQVVVGGPYAYVAGGELGLHVIDVSDPSELHEEAQFASVGDAMAVAAAGTRAYVCDYVFAKALVVVDAADPAAPQVQGACSTGTYPRRVLLRGQYAYVGSRRGGLDVIDVFDPLAPYRVSTFPRPAGLECWDLALAWPYAYLSCADPSTTTSRLSIVNVSQPLTPTLAGQLAITGGQVYAVGARSSYAYVSVREGNTTTLRTVGLARPVAPVQVSRTVLPSYSGQDQGMDVAGSIAFMAYDNGLEIVDVSDPPHPHELARQNIAASAQDVVVAGNQAYVAAGSGGLRVIDVADPAHPHELASYSPMPSANGVAVAEMAGRQRIYVTASECGLYILEFTREFYLPLALR